MELKMPNVDCEFGFIKRLIEKGWEEDIKQKLNKAISEGRPHINYIFTGGYNLKCLGHYAEVKRIEELIPKDFIKLNFEINREGIVTQSNLPACFFCPYNQSSPNYKALKELYAKKKKLNL